MLSNSTLVMLHIVNFPKNFQGKCCYRTCPQICLNVLHYIDRNLLSSAALFSRSIPSKFRSKFKNRRQPNEKYFSQKQNNLAGEGKLPFFLPKLFLPFCTLYFVGNLKIYDDQIKVFLPKCLKPSTI